MTHLPSAFVLHLLLRNTSDQRRTNFFLLTACDGDRYCRLGQSLDQSRDVLTDFLVIAAKTKVRASFWMLPNVALRALQVARRRTKGGGGGTRGYTTYPLIVRVVEGGNKWYRFGPLLSPAFGRVVPSEHWNWRCMLALTSWRRFWNQSRVAYAIFKLETTV